MFHPSHMSRIGRVFSIQPGVPFLQTFVDALLSGRLVPEVGIGAGHLALVDTTIFVPTRRSARALAAAFARNIGAATFLPRILPLGDPDAMALERLLQPAHRSGLDAAQAVSPMARRLVLTRLVLAWSQAVRRARGDGPGQGHGADAFQVAGTPADAWYLSGELADLLDEFALADVDTRALAPLGTESFDRYWNLTLEFLKIATDHWPAILTARGEVEAVSLQKRHLEKEIARWGERPSTGPVVVAGAFGSDPLTLKLLAAIARLPQGAVVLPGVDLLLDDESWTLLGTSPEAEAGHPQAALFQVLAAAGTPRSDVVPIGALPPDRMARLHLASEAFRPAETTDAWSRIGTDTPTVDVADALRRVSLVEAAHEGEEALALAVALREMLDGNGSAVLVTPDRSLARRVREELLRWGIEIDDSGGQALAATPAGSMAELILACITSDLDPVAVLALLAHPASRLARPRATLTRLRRRLERHLLRGIVPKGSLADPQTFVTRAREAAGAATADQAGADRWAALEQLLVDLLHALTPLRDLDRGSLSDWLSAHEAAIGILTAENDTSALGGVDGTRLEELFTELLAHAEPGIELDAGSYAALFGQIAAETMVRGPARSHPRLKILGLLEFRLLEADRVCLGGLDEGIWPPSVRTDAFLNRTMRKALGLAPPEQRIGQFAHDFTMALNHPDVVIGRAAKRGGSPTVPSRFLQRMSAVAGETHWQDCRQRGQRYIDLARALDRPEQAVTIPRPAPKPPVELRPQRLSVTRIETLRRDPYAIYAERILRLRPLDPIGATPGPREWGTAFHGVLRNFIDEVRHEPVTPEHLASLLQNAQAAFAPLVEEPHTRAFMAPRLERWVQAFGRWHGERRHQIAGIHAEAQGHLDIPLDDGSTFALTATADRIEHMEPGVVRLVDYKTGATPTKKEVAAGFAPQLTLEAAIALAGGFAALEAVSRVDQALYVQFGTGLDITSVALDWTDRTLQEVADEHLSGLRDLLNSFRDPSVGYVARPYPQFVARFGDYDHLSRVKEWSATGGLGDPTGDAA